MGTLKNTIMRQIINKFLSASFIACILAGSLFFSACEQEEEMTNPVLKVFGPSPALRGGQLEFIGLNLDQVTSVVLQNNIEVTEITVVTPEKIVITIPQNALPGLVTLKSPKGDIKTITPLTFSEPISVLTVSPATVKAGDKLTITGDYLYLIAEVIFNDNIVVDSADFISQSRKIIELPVPIEAQSGKIILSNGAEIPIQVYSDNVINVTLPVITGISQNPVRPGASLTISGTDFNLVKSLIFAENLKIENLTFNEAKTTITVTVPQDVKQDYFKLVCYSGVEVISDVRLLIVNPEIKDISPNPVKNGKSLTITGTNLDLATKVVFGGNKEGVMTSQSASSILVQVPVDATEGVVTLNTRSGVNSVSENLGFVKPAISSITPLTLMAGNEITITGTNLDLVKKVLFNDGLSVNIENTNESTLTVATPTAAVTGTITLVASNGDQIVSSESLTLEAANKPVVATMTSPVKPGQLLTITGTKLHLVESVIFQNGIKATSFGSRTATLLEVYVPEGVKFGKVTVTLKTYDGGEVSTPEFTISGTDPITANTKMIMDFNIRSTSDWHAVDWDNWGGSYDAAKSKENGYITLVARPGWWVIGCNHPDPNGGWPSVNPANYVFKVDIKTEAPIKLTGGYEFIFKIGGENISSLLIVENGYIATPGNEWATLTIPIEGVLSSPTKTGSEFGIVLNWSDAGIDFTGLSFDNMRFDPK